ncbi:hypothetical protein BX666DRAFT_1839651, partial [Dichotomocladium elegans]
HDRTWPDPLVYLGYPLATSRSQMDVFLAKLLQSLESDCQLHSSRSLSVRARATILNSLILSPIWHVIRIVGVPQ